ncbi:MAG TPA: cytochrome c [Pyrinomonadaceae bacterium]|jgi:mono/diheme cytochrome c family protein
MLKSKLLWTAILSLIAITAGCRYDMQDQPRYKAYKQSDFFADKRASRDLPQGTIPRGQLRSDKALYTGKKDVVDPNAAVQTVKDEAGNTLIASFPNDIDEFPVPVTKELVDRGEQRYKVFCIVCHGPTGNGDGMIVRRGFSKPPTYNDDRLRNAPVGHFFDVITNGQGKMNSYASQVPVADRWAIVAYIRALQISQNPTGETKPSTMTNSNTNTTTQPAQTPRAATSPSPTTAGGRR